MVFWDWETGGVIRRIDVDAKNVCIPFPLYCRRCSSWIDILVRNGIPCGHCLRRFFYVLRFDRDAYAAKVDDGVEITVESVEEAFDVVAEIPDA